ncbi:hypothetical protein BC829DRAFT_400589, partial [Chytridium lagenaria]
SQFFMPPSSRIVTTPTARLNSSTPVSFLPSNPLSPPRILHKPQLSSQLDTLTLHPPSQKT